MSRTNNTDLPTPAEALSPLPRWLPATAWASFVANVGIIATGGAVRLTGSGLGCPTWPMCTPDSLVNTPEMGIHGIIEFGNRTLTGILSILAVLVLVLVWKMRRERRDLFTMAWVVLVGIAAQAVVGGITVLTGLNPAIVGFHYVASVGLVCVTATFLVRMRQLPGPRETVVSRGFRIFTHITSLVMAVTVFFGVMTTGSGPHSGDAAVSRNGFDAVWLSHVHSWPGYILLGMILVMMVWALLAKYPSAPWTFALLIALALQIAVGIYQARSGLPPLAVGVHMVLASLLAAAQTVVILRMKRPSPTARNTSLRP